MSAVPIQSVVTRGSIAVLVAILLVAGVIAPPCVYALRAPQADSPFVEALAAPAGFVATVVPQELSEVRNELPAETLAQIAAFEAEAGSDWRFYVDRRSGGMALVEGRGIPWTQGSGSTIDSARAPGWGPGGQATLAHLESMSRQFMQRYPSLFQVPESQLVLDTRGSMNLGERGQYWSVVFRQIAGGVPVDGARVVFRIAHGNLVQFGVDRTIPFEASIGRVSGLVTPLRARAALATHVGGLQEADTFTEDGTLLWVPRGIDEKGPYTGPIGAGWKPEIVYRFTFLRDGSAASWQVLVDARTAEVLRFVDATDYAALVRGSVYTQTNCTDTLNCVPGSAAEVAITLPFASLNFAGGTCTGDACFSNSAGAFDYPPGAVSAATALDGKYFRIVDQCGAIAASGVAPGNIDLGTSNPNPPINTNTDCAPATRESPPLSGPTSAGSGDTHAARNCFYHLNLINQKARAYLPGNDWLRGVDGDAGQVLVTTNLPPACNAFWQGTTGSLNFMKVTPGLGCNNTGEIPDVFLHEFGHGLDQNDGTGTAPESATGEAMGDTFAMLQGQHSCLGPGVLLPVATNANWGNRAGYGTGSALCTGFRDFDYTRFCYHGTGAGCSASPDPGDAPNGSRSGLTPPPNPPDSGTPARWNHMITGASNATNGQSNFYNCGGPESGTDCAGPLNHGCHCESMIASQANWDLAKKLIAFEFGGNVYASPQGPTEVSGWQYMDRLWYLTRDLAVSAYSVTGPAPAGTTNGCSVSNWFSTYRFIDDNNGNLADGTPHAGIIFQALDLHAIACGSAFDASNQPTGCPVPIAAPTLSACGNKSPVQLNWTPSSGATQYRVLRNTLGCGFGFTPIATTSGGRMYFEDADVAPGVPYFYSVQPVGVNESCYGQASNCIAVTPTTCAATVVATPTGLTLDTPADNQVEVTWNPAVGAGSYKIFRKPGDCSSTEPFAAITVVTAPGTTYLDTDGLLGQQTYSYQIAASDTSCASCTSAPSSCISVVVDGPCVLPATFGGLTGISAAAESDCKINLTWAPATLHCAAPLTFEVYRSTNATFQPEVANRVASGIVGTSYSDTTVTGGVRYFYIVRARDGDGNIDGNMVRLNEVAVGTLSPGTYSDNAGDTGTAKLAQGSGFTNTWSVRPSDTGNATKVYATTPSGDYADNSCMSLDSQTIFLGANPTLSFQSRFDIEQGWDGGYVEVATESGAFNNWTKLSTINYPGIMSGPLGDPACGTPGFADGQMVFTGLSTGYQSFSGSLSAYANQRIRIRFLFSSDPSTTAPGWFLDNISVTGAMVPGACSTNLCINVICTPLDQCHDAGVCNPGTGTCSNPNRADGTSCNDANVCTQGDDCTGGICSGDPVAVTEVGNSLLVTPSGGTSLLSWSDGGNPGTFRSYRGTRAAMAPWSYNQQCLGGPIMGTSTTDGTAPSTGSTLFYLITRSTACGESIAGRNSQGQPVPNNPCP